MSTTQAEMIIGGSRSMWRAAAGAGLIKGAKKTPSERKNGGDWSLPNAAAREYYENTYLKGKGAAAGGGKVAGRGTTPSRSLPAHERGRRGPRQVTLSVVEGGKP